MPDAPKIEWVLPTSIPFAELKGRDLEECVYWTLNAMGAKELEWRVGGTGGGAADGGRDIEATFFTPTADDEVETTSWWVECKGRSGTVEADEVRSAVVNAQARGGLDYIVIATNTQFSNPTRDWVREFQRAHPRPKIKLWDQNHLERLLSRHPGVVLRLFSRALSLKGRFAAMESSFWNKLESAPARTLATMWASRDKIEMTSLGLFAAIASEFANGDITRRPWGATLDREALRDLLYAGFANCGYLFYRIHRSASDERPIHRALAYIVLCGFKHYRAKSLGDFIRKCVADGAKWEVPEDLQSAFLMPIMDQLLTELQDVCCEDCSRISCIRRATITQSKDEIDEYWLRLNPAGVKEAEEPSNYLLLENTNAPCKVGFAVDADHRCPLFHADVSLENVVPTLEIVEKVAKFREAQDIDKRAEAARKARRTKPTDDEIAQILEEADNFPTATDLDRLLRSTKERDPK